MAKAAIEPNVRLSISDTVHTINELSIAVPRFPFTPCINIIAQLQDFRYAERILPLIPDLFSEIRLSSRAAEVYILKSEQSKQYK